MLIGRTLSSLFMHEKLFETSPDRLRMRRLCLTSTDILSAPVIYRESSKYNLSLTVSYQVI